MHSGDVSGDALSTAATQTFFMKIPAWIKTVLRFLEIGKRRGWDNPYFTPRRFGRHMPAKSSLLDGKVSAKTRERELAPLAIEWLKTSDPKNHDRALDFLRLIGPPAARRATKQVVQAAIACRSDVERLPYIEALAKMESGSRVPLPFLSDFLNPARVQAVVELPGFMQPDVYYLAAEILGAHKAGAIPLIMGFIRTTPLKPEILGYYLRALRTAGGGREMPLDELKALVSPETQSLAVEAIELIADYGPEVQGYLTLLLLAGNRDLQEAASNALRRIGVSVEAPKEKSGGLFGLLNSPIALVRLQASSAAA